MCTCIHTVFAHSILKGQEPEWTNTKSSIRNCMNSAKCNKKYSYPIYEDEIMTTSWIFSSSKMHFNLATTLFNQKLNIYLYKMCIPMLGWEGRGGGGIINIHGYHGYHAHFPFSPIGMAWGLFKNLVSRIIKVRLCRSCMATFTKISFSFSP